jgi:hypothetical protein
MWRIPLALLCFAGAACAADHVRVILDNSGSMKGNDSPRLAALSTLLLYDLADPNLTRDDNFEVLTFDPAQPLGFWRSGPPPVQNGPRIKALAGQRAALADQLKAIPYKANNTYYYPILKEAITDLKATPGGTTDRRVIVLITDGMPEDPEPYRSQIAHDLLSELEPNRIRLYVIAFGPDASRGDHADRLREILRSNGVAEPLIDPTGQNLLDSMIRIFSRSFGYSYDNPTLDNGRTLLDLERGNSPARVAMVTFWTKSAAPSLTVSPPPNGILNNPDGIQTGQETGAAYRLAWVVRPNAGHYKLEGSPGATVAVLRPATLLLDVIPKPPVTQTQVTMASPSEYEHVEFPLRVMTRLPGGVRGDPGGDLKFSFITHGPSSPRGYDWDLSAQGAINPNGESPNHDGRYYDIAPWFPPDKESGREYYEGWVTAEVRRGDATLGAARHRILVYPFLRLSPDPPFGDAAVDGQVREIRGRETGCATFKFRIDGTLPHPDRPMYSLRAVVDKSFADDPRLVRARFTLDGAPVDYEDTVSDHHSAWYGGRPLGVDALKATHNFCITGGKPRSMDRGPVVEVPLQFEIMEPPYDSLQSVRPVAVPWSLKARIAPPTFVEKYGSWLAIALGLLALLLIAWYTRYRATVPPTLRWAVAKGNSPSAPVPAMLGDGPLIPRLLGMKVSRVAYVDVAAGAWELGKVRPVDADLYEFVPAAGVTIAGGTIEDGQPGGGLSHLLAVRQTYQAKAGDRGEYVFRLEYDSR